MKTKYFFLLVSAAVGALLISGCSKQETPASKTPATPVATESPAPETPKPATTPVAPATLPDKPLVATPVPETPPAPPTVTPPPAPASVSTPVTPPPSLQSVTSSAAQLLEAQKLALGQSATSQVQGVTATATNQVQALIERAKSLTANQKYQEALTAVQQLSTIQLTPAQQQLVDNLKAQIQSGIAKSTSTNPASIIGNILGGKK